ncbi:MAG: hypothetical protein IEMM0008_0817 [bacterium]|nr:MAG: hypothetical protein IEMM0008_0817 [bacterium]
MFQFKSLLENDIIRTGFLLGGFGGLLVLILAILNHVTADDIMKAQEGVEKRARSKVFQNAYIHYELPSNLKFKRLISEKIHIDESKDRVANKTHYDSKHKILVYLGFMSRQIKSDLDQLLNESRHKESVQQLFDKTNDLNKVKYRPIYIIKKTQGQAYPIFNEVVQPPGFESLKEKEIIVFTVDQEKQPVEIDRLNLKGQPLVITKIQYNELRKRFREERLKIPGYYEVYTPDPSAQKATLNGWVIKFSAPNGYGGNIGMLIGFDKQNKITGYRMVEHNETPGLGVKANNDSFIAAFIGKEPSNMPKGKKEYKPQLGINSIAGATITSIAVTNGIRLAFKQLNSLKKLEPSKEGQEDGQNVDTSSNPVENGEEISTDNVTADQIKADQAKADKIKAAKAKAAQGKRVASVRGNSGSKKSGTRTYIIKTRGALIPPTHKESVSTVDPKDQKSIDSLFKNKDD